MPPESDLPFLVKMKPKSPRSKWLDRCSSIAVSLALALLAWLYASNRDQEVLDPITIPVEITLNPAQADNYLLEILGPKQAAVSFKGSPLKIRQARELLQKEQITARVEYSIPDGRLKEAKFSDTILVSEENMHLFRGVHPRMVEGKNRIPITVHKLVEKNLPVQVETGGFSLSNSQILFEPASVAVRGPQEILERTKAIQTVPWTTSISFSPQGKSPRDFKVSLARELEGKPVQTKPDYVTVKLLPEPRKVYEIKEIPIRFLYPADFPFRPSFQDERSRKVDLRVEGPVLPQAPRILAFIDLAERPGVAGVQVEKVQIQLPRDFSLLEEFPRDRTIELFLPEKGGKVPPGLPEKP
ncbi:MAG: hypothetical protein EXR99_04535 [Gemmataceae bacterium]|nr:hypothetical protein [Gemmataceae bacterium]